MVTKSIRLTEAEATNVRSFVEQTGETEASVLKRAMLRGLEELRLEQAILDYLRNGDSAAAANLAGLPRARFLDLLADRGVTLLGGPSTVRSEVAFLAETLGSARLRAALAATASDPSDG
jgi:predicted DNA-binding protein